MSELLKVLRKQQFKRDTQDREGMQFAQAVFNAWRNRYMSDLAAYIRIYRKSEELGLRRVEPFRSVEWCSAALDFLSHADDELADMFMRSEYCDKDKIIAAAIEDGGVYDQFDRFVPLHDMRSE